MTLEEAIKYLDATDDYAWPIVKEKLKILIEHEVKIREEIEGWPKL